MQIQKINTNGNSPNRAQRPSASPQNFGMRLVFDENALRKFAGDEHIHYIEAAFENMGAELELVKRFKNVFAQIYGESKHRLKSLMEPSQFSPSIIPDWDKIEIEPSFRIHQSALRRDRKKTIVAELTHDEKSGVFAKGKSEKTDLDTAVIESLDKALDDYARKMIYEAIGT